MKVSLDSIGRAFVGQHQNGAAFGAQSFELHEPASRVQLRSRDVSVTEVDYEVGLPRRIETGYLARVDVCQH